MTTQSSLYNAFQSALERGLCAEDAIAYARTAGRAWSQMTAAERHAVMHGRRVRVR